MTVVFIFPKEGCVLIRIVSFIEIEVTAHELQATLNAERDARTIAEQRTAVLAERLVGLDIRPSDSIALENQAIEKLAEVQKQLKVAETKNQNNRYPRCRHTRKLHASSKRPAYL